MIFFEEQIYQLEIESLFAKAFSDFIFETQNCHPVKTNRNK